jgi:hypothetical protein
MFWPQIFEGNMAEGWNEVPAYQYLIAIKSDRAYPRPFILLKPCGEPLPNGELPRGDKGAAVQIT